MAKNCDCPRCGVDAVEHPPKMVLSIDPPGFMCKCSVCGFEWFYHNWGECL